jgi:SecD/SecF fusion protein
MPPLINLFIVIALLVVPFALGVFIANRLRMPDYGWKIGLIFWTLFSSIVILAMYWPPKLGIDLSGGMILIYEVDQSKLKPEQVVDMDKVVGAVSKRINPVGIKEINIRKYGADGVEIIIPDVDEAAANRIADLVSRVGTLEFRILANTRDNSALIERAKNEPTLMVLKDSEGNREAWWVPVKEGEEGNFPYPEIAKRTRKQGNKTITEVLVVKDNYDVTGDYLDHARPGIDQEGKPCVNFVFNSQGGRLFGLLTSENLPDEVQDFYRKLGIILDGYLYSAPRIKTTIYQQGEISGSFTQAEVEKLVDVLNAGALPATLTKQPISQLYSGPTLGSDTIRKSTWALTYASILVPLFMLWYYRFCGVIADLVLALNLVLLLAIMITIKATFTLSGFAGLALTVGMAVDNNVLIYERLREELAKGATLRMAIRNAFHRASATIIDCNITHMIAAIVLYVIGNEQVKGFALTLLLGVSISLFTSVFVARVIFDIAEKHRWITQLKMHHLVGHTEIDFMSLFPYCATVSLVLVVLGLGVSFWRGTGLFDIDFTGGVSVQTLFKKQQNIGQLRNTLEKMPDFFPDVTISEVRFGDELNNLRFDINTSNANIDQVKGELKKLFANELRTNELKVEDLSPIKSARPEKETAQEQLPAEKIIPVSPPAETAAPPIKSEPPSENKQSRRWPRSSSLMAFVSAMPLMFAEAEAPAAALPAPVTVAQQANDSPRPDEAKTIPENQPPPPTAAENSATAKPEAEKSAAETPAAETPIAEKPPAEKATAEAPTAEKPLEKTTPEVTAPGRETGAVQVSDPFLGGTQARLIFSEKLDHQSVEDLLKNAMSALKLDDKEIPLEIKSEEEGYVEGSRLTYHQWTVKIGLPPEKAETVFNYVRDKLAEAPFFPASNAIGGAVAVSARYQAFYALLASWLLIILYLWIRFQGVAFGLAAVIALVHDVLITLGAIAFSLYLAPYFGWLYIDPFKINLPIIAAFLTIIGYSVNDTIVVFDRIREVRGKDPNMTATMVNISTNQTLSRTLLTSLTVFIVVVVLYFFGGQALRGFSFALIAGVITGTYSSIYVAAPILLWLVGKKE